MDFYLAIAIFLIVMNLCLIASLLGYWFLNRQFSTKEYYRNLIATSFTYNFQSKRFYFEQKPWFINQHRNTLPLLLRLMARASAVQFEKFLQTISTSKRGINPLNRPQIAINFFLHRRIEGCKITILKLNRQKNQMLGIMTNLYE